MMKEVSLKVVENGGIVRSVKNHGLRTFPHRYKAKYPDILTQQRYYEKGRFISFYYDAFWEYRYHIVVVLPVLGQRDHIAKRASCQ